MTQRLIAILVGIFLAVSANQVAVAAPYAAMVMDARTGKILHSRNADTRLHPASLTKMMTLYIAFEAIERGEISLNTRVKITKHAASEPPSKLGLRAGQKIQMRYLIRAAAVKSANDAATAIGIAISGSEAAFARRMTRTAHALGMSRTKFRNAHGLTQSGHYSTANDMTILGRHVLYDYPEYYNLFSRRKTDAGVRNVSNTNTRLLQNYRGADGIKTGYTRAAGFNLVASAQRGRERVIATVFGGKSTASRNARVAELLDMGFKRAPTYARLRRPGKPPYIAPKSTTRVAQAPTATPSGRTVRAITAVKRSFRPQARPVVEPAPVLVAATQSDVQNAVLAAANVNLPPVEPAKPVAVALTGVVKPQARPALTQVATAQVAPILAPSPTASETNVATVVIKETPAPAIDEPITKVPRILADTSRDWGINIGKYPSRNQAERVLLRMALAEMSTLDGANRLVKPRSTGYDALFTGLTRDSADLACRRLQAQKITCLMIGPS